MRTLAEIDKDILAKANAVAANHSENPPFMSSGEVAWLNSEMQFGEKYREMYGILQVLEEYLKINSIPPDGELERQSFRKKLKEMLNNL